jgi:hypothetical protein
LKKKNKISRARSKAAPGSAFGVGEVREASGQVHLLSSLGFDLGSDTEYTGVGVGIAL